MVGMSQICRASQTAKRRTFYAVREDSTPLCSPISRLLQVRLTSGGLLWSSRMEVKMSLLALSLFGLTKSPSAVLDLTADFAPYRRTKDIRLLCQIYPMPRSKKMFMVYR